MTRKRRATSFVRTLSMPFPGLRGVGSLIFVGVSSVLLLVSIVSPASVSGLRMAAADAAAPVLDAATLPLRSAAAFVRDASGIAALQSENRRLAEENDRLREWYQTALLLEAENKSLKDLMNVRADPANTYITARVLGDSGNAFVKSLLIAAGENDGVRKGQAVLAGAGLVGRVIESGQRSARVLLLTDINSRIPVLVEDSRQHAILAGGNDRAPFLDHLPAGTAITDGARIVTSGHGGIFPQGLPVGHVAIVPGGAYRVELFADIDRLMHVRVVDRPDDPNLQSAP